LHGLPAVVKHGFKLLGLYPYDSKTTLGRCAIVIPEKEQQLILKAIPELAIKMKTQGQITEGDMDEKNIPITPDEQTSSKPKDQRTQAHQRAITLTHATSVTRRKDYLEDKNKPEKKKKKNIPKTAEERLIEEKNKEEKKARELAEKSEKEQKKAADREEAKQKKLAVALEKDRQQHVSRKEKEEAKLQKINNKRKKLPSHKDKGTGQDHNTNTNPKRKKQDSNTNNPISIPIPDSSSSSSSSSNMSASSVPQEIEPFVDLIFGMVDKVQGTHNHHAIATSVESLRTLLCNPNRIKPIALSSKDIKSTLYWDNECYQINLSNIPRHYSIPGPVLNPFLSMSSKDQKFLEQKQIADPDRVNILLPGVHKKFLSPIPCFSSDSFNQVTRSAHFKPNETLVVKTTPRVCQGHVDHGFGWLYSVQGIKIVIFINEVDRDIGSSTKFVRGCPITGTWDFNVLGRSPHVKYFILQPGSLVVIPPSVKYIVISPEDSLAYGSFLSHVYGAVSDLAHYLNLHRETNPDLPTLKDSVYDLGVRESNILATQIITTVDIDNHMTWNHQKLRTLVQAKKASYLSKDRSLKVKLDKILKSVCISK